MKPPSKATTRRSSRQWLIMSLQRKKGRKPKKMKMKRRSERLKNTKSKSICLNCEPLLLMHSCQFHRRARRLLQRGGRCCHEEDRALCKYLRWRSHTQPWWSNQHYKVRLVSIATPEQCLLDAFSHHKGLDAFGNTFGQAHKDLKAVYITPFQTFLRKKFRELSHNFYCVTKLILICL